MAEQVPELVQENRSSHRGGDFLFNPVGSRPFMTPERFTEEQRQFFVTGSGFLQSDVFPAIARIEAKDNDLLRQLLGKAGDLGLTAVDVPEAFGGLGLDETTSMLVAESQSGYASWATTFGAHVGIGSLPIVFFGTPEQKARYLPDLAPGRTVAAYALSEAGSGSDAVSAKTVARLSPDGKHYVKNIASFGLIREKRARAAAQTYASEAMTYRAAGAIDDAIAQLSDPGDSQGVMAAIEEYAIEASIMKVTGSEWMFQIIDEALQIHGGNGFVEDYPIERAYRDCRVNRIFEGTNEINRLLIPGMIFKRAMKGEMPLLQAVQRVDEELADQARFSPPVGRLAAERRDAEMAKRQFLFAAKWAATLGPSLEERQEVLAALADVAIEAYAMDSVLGRTLAASGDTALRDALCKLFCAESRERAFARARSALCDLVPPGEIEAQLQQLARLHKFTAVNTSEVREEIVPAILEAGGYPLAY